MAVETPNGAEISIGAKTYLCAGRLLPAAGMMFGYPTPQGQRADARTLAKGIFGVTIDWLHANGFVQLWEGVGSFGFQKPPVLMVRSVYSGAPGFSGRLLEATKWQDANLVEMAQRILPRAQAPFLDFLDDISGEFAAAGILTRGGYAAHGNVWNAEWLGYLTEAWLPEVWEAWQRTHARADWPLIERNVMLAVAGSQHTERDD